MSISEYNGSAIVAMAGKNCVAIGSDLRLGVQLQTNATDRTLLCLVFARSLARCRRFRGTGTTTPAPTRHPPPRLLVFHSLAAPTSTRSPDGTTPNPTPSPPRPFTRQTKRYTRSTIACSWACLAWPRTRRPSPSGLRSNTTCIVFAKSGTSSRRRSGSWCRRRFTRSGLGRISCSR